VVFLFSLFLSLYRCLCFDTRLFLILSFIRKAFISFTVFTPYDISFISLFVPILQRSLARIGQYIFRTIFRSDILSAFVSCFFVIQALTRQSVRVILGFCIVLI
jgi:hypothetical protein